MKFSRSVFSLLIRSFRLSELKLLLLSLSLSVATVTCINVFTHRIQNSLLQESAALLAGDARVNGSMEIPKEWKEGFRSQGLEYSDTLTFSTMSYAGDRFQLSSVRGVANNFPLRGELLISEQPFGKAIASKSRPKSGEAWLSSRLFEALDISIGDYIEIGEAKFTVSKALIQEPGSSQSFFGTAPRVLINLDDVDKTAAIKPGSRARYATLLAGDKKNIKATKEWLEDKLGNHYRWLSAVDSNRGVSSALEKAQQFFLLAGCLGVLLSGAAVSLSASRYARSQTNSVALLKTFGLSPRKIFWHYLLFLIAIGFLCICFGSLLGWSLHWALFLIMQSVFPVELAAASFNAFIVGILTGLIALISFAAPPIAQLQKIMPMRILKEQHNMQSTQRMQLILGAASMILLIYLYSQSIKLTAILCGAILFSFAFIGILSQVLLKVLQSLSKHWPHSFRLGVSSLQRHKSYNGLQASIFSILLMLVFILMLARTSLIQQWQNQLPDDAPNHFLFNVFLDEKEQISDFFQKQNIAIEKFYPMNAGRVIKVNGEDLKSRVEKSENNVNYKRELNLSWSDKPGSDNKILQGDWWPSQTSDQSLVSDQALGSDQLLVSAEENYAKGLQLKIGDTLTFSVAGQEFNAKLTSIRSVQWDSMNPNFYMLFNKAFLDGSSANWLTSFYLAEDRKLIVNELLKTYPSVSLIEIDQTLKQVHSIMSKVSMAVEFILLLVSVSGVILLVACIQATLDTRKQESAVIRALGGSQKLIRNRLLTEFSLLGVLAGLIALVGSEIALYYLSSKIFDLPFQAHWQLWIFAPLTGAVLIGTTGWLSLKNLLKISPLNALKQNQ